MSYVQIVIATQALTLWKNNANAFGFKFVDPVLTVIDVTSWYLLEMKIYAQVNGENCLLGLITLTGLCSFVTPTDTFNVPNTSMTSANILPSGSYSYALQGKESSGDEEQTIASGSLQLLSPDDFTPAP